DHNHDATYAPIGSGAHLPVIRPMIAASIIAPNTTVAFAADGSCRAYYRGPADQAYTSITVTFRVSERVEGSVTWAELGIGTSDALTAIDDSVNITTRGYTSIASAITSIGVKTVTIAVSGVNAGDPLWLTLA